MNGFKVVLISSNHDIPDWVGKKFEEEKVEFVFHECQSREDLEKYAGDADVIWFMSGRKGLVAEENMDIFRKAGVVIKYGSGTDNIDHDACTKRGIIVAHTPDDPSEPTSDHAIAMLFTSVRQTASQDRLVRKGVWDQKSLIPIGKFAGADLGIIGFGRIGKAIVRKLSGFKMNVRVFDPYVDKAALEKAGCKKAGLDELIKESQYIMVTCPLTKETRYLIGDKEFDSMRSDAVLVNTARGGIVNEQALYRALKENRIKAAALDVVENPPLEQGNQLLTLENICFTPWMGGYPSNYPDALFDVPVSEIIEMSKGHSPKWIANRGVVPKWRFV